MTPQKFSNILVIQPMPGIGDMIWFVPHIRAIAHHFSKTGKVSLLARPSAHAATLLSEEDSVGDIIPLYRCQMNRQGQERDPHHRTLYKHDGVMGLYQLGQDLALKNFDATWILDRRAYYTMAAFLAGIPHRFGLGFGVDKILLQSPLLNKQYHKMHARDRATHFLEAFNIQISDFEYPLKISKKDLLKRKIPQKDNIWVCLGIGASEQEKKWPVGCFAGLINILCQKGITCFICGGPGEKEEAAAIKKVAGKAYESKVHTITDWTVMETAALMTQSDFYVGNDTFLYNLAALQGKKALSISGVVPSHTYRPEMMTIWSQKGVQHVTPQQVLKKLMNETFLVCS